VLLAGFVATGSCRSRRCHRSDYPTIQVFTFLPGASPEVMASSVTAPLERQFGQTPGSTDAVHSSGGASDHAAVRFASAGCREQGVQAAINAGSN